MYQFFHLNNCYNNYYSTWITHFIFMDKYSEQLARHWSPFPAHHKSRSFTSSTAFSLHFVCHLRRLMRVRPCPSFVAKCLWRDSPVCWREGQLARKCPIDYGYKELFFSTERCFKTHWDERSLPSITLQFQRTHFPHCFSVKPNTVRGFQRHHKHMELFAI